MDKYIVIPLLCLLFCQLLKFIIESVKNKKIIFKRFIKGSGGIPSSHTTLITSITLLIGLDNKFQGGLFGLALVMLYIVCYDAMGIRNEVEKHSRLLNKIAQENFEEEVGHNSIEVFIGLIFGIVSTLLLNNLF